MCLSNAVNDFLSQKKVTHADSIKGLAQKAYNDGCGMRLTLAACRCHGSLTHKLLKSGLLV